ncbi:MAG: hypothetical protein ABJF16_18745, partial [Lentilitoribacter sp.]
MRSKTNSASAVKSKPTKDKASLWGGVVFLLFVIAALVFGAVKANGYMQDEQQMPVQVIDFSGDYQHVNISRLERLIRKSQPGSFFALDVNEVFEL